MIIKDTVFKRTYTWDEKGRLTATSDQNADVEYLYGEDNQRAVKSSDSGENLYFNNFWTWSNNSAVYNGERTAKHIFLGSERIVTKLNSANHPTYSEESASTYYYHSDHLGSASVISDNDGREYERIEYTPYGEVWIDKASATFKTAYRFTGKERDDETGLYYFGERYLDAKVSRWLSTDPALSEYMAGTSAGEGGIFNSVNMNLYHYGGNNAPRYVDPDGRKIVYTLFNKKPEIKEIKKALDKIRQSKDGAELLEKLEKSDSVIKIYAVKGDSSNETVVDEKGKKGGSGSKIYWNIYSKEGGEDDEGNTEREPFVGLAHELGHAESFADGNYDMNKGDGTPGTTPSGEKNSLKRENQIRLFFKFALRSFYYPKVEKK